MLCSLFLSCAGLGSAWGPVEFGYPVACAQCWGELLCFLFAGPDPPAWTSAPSEICTGRTGHEQVRRNKSECSPVFPTEATSSRLDSVLFCLFCLYNTCIYLIGVIFCVFQRWCPTEPDHCSTLPPRSWGSDASTERRAHPWTVSSCIHILNSILTKKTRERHCWLTR